MQELRPLGEQESGEGQAPQPEASAVPESIRAVHEQGRDSADPAFGDELSLFPGQSKSTGTLDLAAVNDEPEQLVRNLIVAANEWIDSSENSDKWKVILGHLAAAQKELDRLNEPASHRGAKRSSP